MAGPLYLLVGLAQILTRDGFDIRVHALSLLSNGPWGWVQIGNFLLGGALVMAGAVGCRRALRGQPAGTWGPMMLAVYGLGVFGAGVFPADPAQGFPPGATGPEQITTAGVLHFVFGAVGFYALVAACFIFMRRFMRQRRPGLAWYSAMTGAGFLLSFGAIASGSHTPVVMVAFYIAVTWLWIWHTVVLVDVLRRPAMPRRGAVS